MIMPNTQGYRGDTEPKAPGKLPNGEQVGDSQAESARTRENPGVGVLGNGWITGCLGRDRSQSTNCCWASGRLGSRVGEWHRCKHQRSREAACSQPRLIAIWWLGAKSPTLSGSEILYPAGENPGAQICSQHPWPPQRGRAEGRAGAPPSRPRHCPQSRDIKHVPLSLCGREMPSAAPALGLQKERKRVTTLTKTAAAWLQETSWGHGAGASYVGCRQK